MIHFAKRDTFIGIFLYDWCIQAVNLRRLVSPLLNTDAIQDSMDLADLLQRALLFTLMEIPVSSCSV